MMVLYNVVSKIAKLASLEPVVPVGTRRMCTRTLYM